MASPIAVAASNVLSFSQGSNGGGSEAVFGGQTVLRGPRYQELDRRQSYYECKQHDQKGYDFDGRVYDPNAGLPFISQEKTPYLVPLSQRRPSAPYRIGRLIVNSFTSLLFGDLAERFPVIRVTGDADAEDFAQTLATEGDLPLRMVRARQLGGSMGSVAVSWRFKDGLPRYTVRNAKNLFVHEWKDRESHIPAHVTEVYPTRRQEWDGKQYAWVWYWYRRDWTLEEESIFKPIRYERGVEPVWEKDDARSVKHGDDDTHVVWIQNLPNDEDLDGFPDYEGCYEDMDELDVEFSVVMRGGKLNLDPTLVLNIDPEIASRTAVKKGSENALMVGLDGDAKYLELAGTSIDSGLKLVEALRKATLEVAECIIPDPHEVAAQGVSSVAIKAMFAPMIGKAGILRGQYGNAIQKLVRGPLLAARRASKTVVTVVDAITGEEVRHVGVVALPPKLVQTPVMDTETGEPTGEVKEEAIDRTPGEGGQLKLAWPPWFPPTPDDLSKTATTMSLATGGKAFLSKQTAVESTARMFGADPAEEWRRVQAQGKADAAAEKAKTDAFGGGDAGGEGDEDGGLPEGATPRGKGPPTGSRDPVSKEDDE